MSSDRHRRSLLSGTPRPQVRAVRPSARPEDAPTIPVWRTARTETRQRAEVPPDPGAVEFDFEPEEIPFEALEFLDPPKNEFDEPDPDTDAIVMEELDSEAIEAIDDEDINDEGGHDQDITDETANDEAGADPTDAPMGGGIEVRAQTDPAPLESPGPQNTPNSGPQSADNSSSPTPMTDRSPTRQEAYVPAPVPPIRTPAPVPERRHRASPLWRVPAVFLASMAATVCITLIPWFFLLSPRLHAVQAAQQASTPQVVEVKVPTPVPVPVPVIERVLVRADGTEVPAGEFPAATAAVALAPEAETTTPTPAPKARSKRRPPTRKAAAPPEPVAEPEAPVATAPVKPKADKPPPPPPAPAEARALNGRYGGKVSGMPLLFDLEFLAGGSLKATIQRGVEKPITTTGRYALSGNRATVAFVEPIDGGASYSATVSRKGASGRINYPSGKHQRISLDH